MTSNEGQRLPPGWVEVSLGEVADIRLGKQRTPDRATGANLRPYLRAGNITWEGLDLSDVKSMNFTDEEAEVYELRSGDVLLNEASGSEAEVGKAALYQGEIEGCCFQNTVIRIRPASILMSEYLRQYLWHDARRGKFIEHGRGIGINHLGFAKVQSWRVQIPPIDEQRRIVARLNFLLSYCHRARGVLATYPALVQKYREAVLDAAFRGSLTAHWRTAHKHELGSAAELLTRIQLERREQWEKDAQRTMKEEGHSSKDISKSIYLTPDTFKTPVIQVAELFGDLTQREWACCSMNSIVEAERGITYGIVKTGHEFSNGVPTVRGGDIKNYRVVRATLKKVAPSIAAQYERSRLRGGEVLLAIRGSVGEAAVAGEELEGCNISREVGMLPVLSSIRPQYIAFLLTSPAGRSMLETYTKGVAQTGINLSDLRDLAVPLPSLLEQDEIVREVERRFKDSEIAERRAHEFNRECEALEGSILSSAFDGKLVPQNSQDESAAVVLERLRVEQRSAQRNIPSRQSPKVGASKVKRVTKEFVIEVIQKMPDDRFSFEELRAYVPAEYDVLKDIVFTLLDEPSPNLKQIFDTEVRAIRFERGSS